VVVEHHQFSAGRHRHEHDVAEHAYAVDRTPRQLLLPPLIPVLAVERVHDVVERGDVDAIGVNGHPSVDQRPNAPRPSLMSAARIETVEKLVPRAGVDTAEPGMNRGHALWHPVLPARGPVLSVHRNDPAVVRAEIHVVAVERRRLLHAAGRLPPRDGAVLRRNRDDLFVGDHEHQPLIDDQGSGRLEAGRHPGADAVRGAQRLDGVAGRNEDQSVGGRERV